MATAETSDVLNFRNQVAAGGKIYLPPSKLHFTDTLTFPSKCVSIIGDYRDLCYLDFSQMTDPTKNSIELDRM